MRFITLPLIFILTLVQHLASLGLTLGAFAGAWLLSESILGFIAWLFVLVFLARVLMGIVSLVVRFFGLVLVMITPSLKGYLNEF